MNRGRFSFAVAILSLTFSLASRAQVSFFQPPTYSGRGTPFVYDFNGDGKPDILTGSDGTMNLGNGDGTFTPGTPVSGVTASNPILAVGDFNGDGKWDLLEQGLGTLNVLLGNGDGTFQAPISTSSGASFYSVVVTSLRGNGLYDVIGVFDNNLLVYVSKGDGTFVSPAATYSLGALASDVSILVSVGDFNGDQKQDVVVSEGDLVSSQEMTFLGNGDGTLNATPVISAGGVGYPYSVAVADFTSDGKLDLAIEYTVSGSSPPVDTMVGLGNGGFSVLTTSVPYGGLAAADLRGIGKQDLVVTPTFSESGAYIYLGNGDGTFSNANNYVFAGNSVIADINLDGKQDLIGGNSVLLGNGDGTFQGIPFGLINSAPTSNDAPAGAIVLGNFENNGVNDAAALTYSAQPSTVYILHNNGAGVLSLIATYSIPNIAIYDTMLTADLRGNGNLDLIVGGTGGYSVLLGNGDGTFQSPLYSNIGNIGFMAVADVNNDHKPDLIIQGGSEGGLMVLLGNGDGSFQSPVSYYDAGLGTLLIADFNGDGKLDIAASGFDIISGTYFTGILYGNGDGTFQDIVFPAILDNVEAYFTADFNNDNKPDLLVEGGSGVQIVLGNGDGTFTPLPALPFECFTPKGIADFNKDGIADIVGYSNCSSHPAGADTVVLGNGDGTFGSGVNVPAPYGFMSLFAVGDMNGDGFPDFVFSYPGGELEGGVLPTGLGVLLNTTLAGPPQPDFRVIATELSPSPILPGSSATSTVTVTPLNGFTGNVALSCGGVPTGVSCAFNPASISGGSGTSVLTLSAALNAAPGSYSFTVNGTSGSLTRIGALNLTVAPGTPDFQISATAASPSSIAAGASATSTVTITSLSGFGGAVALTCNSGNSNVTCSLNPASITPTASSNGTSTLTVNAATGAVAGAYNVTVDGISGSDMHSTSVVVTVGTPDFSLGAGSGSPTSQTISAGQTASFTLSFASMASFTGTINLSCGITPAVTPAPTCSLSSSSVQMSGSGTQTVTVKVGTTAPVTSGTAWQTGWPMGWPLGWATLVLGTAGLLAGARKRRLALVVPTALFLLLSISCGGGGGSSTNQITPGTPAGTYTATVTATSGSLSHDMALKVVVQ